MARTPTRPRAKATRNGDGDVDLLQLAELLGVGAVPGDDPVGFTGELRAKFQAALDRLGGDDADPSGDDEEAAVTGNALGDEQDSFWDGSDVTANACDADDTLPLPSMSYGE